MSQALLEWDINRDGQLSQVNDIDNPIVQIIMNI